MHESLNGLIDPPHDYGVYNMSWVSTRVGLVPTMEDLNDLAAALGRDHEAPARHARARTFLSP
ncbi:hypothetical protein E1193_11445 [Micromonospora sp. KC606]|uniref:hypothetical protein n=1 Tax=Micromonospora sp. KC606 TaxID=2530379 RepID=UPI0010525F7A|nr:hypothetical protein [Micromonospora sp. KC606]TDC82542.1 hypothetical protein E1193_11445 [Micromonospora sp. KC606]